ncbi:tRNA-splicing endonuclease subunit Sen2 isoform X2 [Neocloeon triangulifer]|uniref:tRNA-splicing endonuclease subunit Sen2 isoform X2 n=1 Tax=Neocloeon triangulifer TaxID=2078957 RepID=UPI00286EE613|nr:tRNA-splicing endonuclease subunit Sen2 isoform X2 [Neocloeon triangulifer]
MKNRQKLTNFQPKHHGQVPRSSHHPLPIVIEDLSGFPPSTQTWPCYAGIFTGHTIIVPNKEDAQALYSMGSFGNPLTRHFNSNKPPILRQRQYNRRLKWSEQSADAQPGKNSSESDGELELSDVVYDGENNGHAENGSEFNQGAKQVDEIKDIDSNVDDDVIVEQEVRVRQGRSWYAPFINWSMEEQESKINECKPSSPQVIDIDDEISIVNGNGQSKDRGNHNSGSEVTQVCIDEDDDIEIINDEPPVVKSSDVQENMVESKENEDQEDKPEEMQIIPLAKETYINMSIEDTREVSKEDKLCDEGDFAVVIKDTDCQDSKANLIKHWEPQMSPLPSKSCDESLALSLEEAFFLSWALCCLRISVSKVILHEFENNTKNSPQPGPSGLQNNNVLIDLTPTFSWALFSYIQPTFPIRYVVYHYLKSKGWVVRSGSKLGGDYVIYKDSPSRYHASSIVLVESDVEKLSWQRLLTLNRVAEATSKSFVGRRVFN